jgi:hypothetical protein
MVHGKWTGQAIPGRRNAAQGSWNLENDSGAAIMHGTWSAVQEAGTWRGTFVARTAGRAFSGTWKADLGDAPGKRIEEMLQRAIQKEVTGVWESGGSFGEWWLRGP